MISLFKSIKAPMRARREATAFSDISTWTADVWDAVGTLALGVSAASQSLEFLHPSPPPFFLKWRKIWIRDVVWSRYLGCWGQSTSQI